MVKNIKQTKNSVKHPDQRVGVFIDVQNMYYSAKNLYGAKVNFGNIVKEAVAGRKLIRAIAYVVRTEEKQEQPFFDALYNLGIETKERPLQIFQGGEKKADWDVGITVDAIRVSPSIDTIILVSGDGDYIPLVEYLRNQGKQVEVAAFGGTTSSKLVDVVDDFIDLGEDKAKFLIADYRKKQPIRKSLTKPAGGKINNKIVPRKAVKEVVSKKPDFGFNNK